jgi:hypothetical protein
MKSVLIKLPIETVDKFEKKYNSIENCPPIVITNLINRGALLEGIFSVKDSKIDSKIFHSWKLYGLLPTIPKGQWGKLSYVDLVYLYILESMRNFGCKRSLMKTVSTQSINLYDIITNYLIENNETFLIIYSDGRFSTKNKNIDIFIPHIVIPISSLIKKSMSDLAITRKLFTAYDFIN